MESIINAGRFWPQPLQSYLREMFGEPLRVEALGGMSGAGVSRVHFAGTSVIIKARTSANEAWFYRDVAPILDERGIASPICHWNATVAGSRWLVLEDIRQPLPRGRWLADPAVLGMLRRLHQTPVATLPLSPTVFRPAWTPEASESALSCLPPDDAKLAGPSLDAMRAAAQPLFTASGIISGDPNPANWGVRANGDPVLFDWERFGSGAPALDLAIIVPGLGDIAAYRQVADAYLVDAATPAIDALAREIACAKVWTIVEFLAGTVSGVAQPQHGVVDWLIGQLPPWLDEIGI